MALSQNHAALGKLNRNFPIWDLGGWWYWEPRFAGKLLQEAGRVQLETGSEYDVTYTQTDAMCVWDPGKGRFVEFDPTVAVIAPPNGENWDGNTNYWNASSPAVSASRGPFTAQAGLTLTDYNTAGTNHILETLTGVPATTPRITNSSGGIRRLYRQETRSAAFGRRFGVLVKLISGGTIDASNIRIGMADIADPLGADISVLATQYTKIRSDGWYQIWNECALDAGPADAYYFIEVEDGVDAIYECPTLVSGTTGVSPDLFARPSLTGAVGSETRSKYQFEGFATQDWDLPQAGWLGCSIVPLMNAGSYGTELICRMWSAAASPNDYHRIFISNANQTVVYNCNVGGVDQAYLGNSVTDDLVSGEAIGFVATWGHRGGTVQFAAARNGSIEEVDVSGTLPSRSDCQVDIAYDQTNSYDLSAECYAVAGGRRMLSRYEIATLSKWFETKAKEQTTWDL